MSGVMPRATRKRICGCTSPTCDARSKRTRYGRASSSPSRGWDTVLKLPERGAGAVIGWTTWLGLAGIATGIMVVFRSSLDPVHIALVYLLLVLGASAQCGRSLGLSLALLTFLSFNF